MARAVFRNQENEMLRGMIVMLVSATPLMAQCAGGVCTPSSGYPVGLMQQPSLVMPQLQPIAQASGAFDLRRVNWWTDDKKPGVIFLYVDNQKVGSIDPWEGTWSYENYPPQDLIAFISKHSPPERFKEQRGKLKIESRGKLDYSKIEATIKEEEKAKVEQKDKPKPKAYIVEEDGDGTCLGMDGCVKEVIDGSSPDERTRFRGNFGIMDNRLRTNRYSISGRDVGAAEALDALGGSGGNVPDDSGLLRITIIGNEAARKAVLRDFDQSPELAYWKGKVMINTYEPSNWRIKDGGFKVPSDPAKPVIYFQKPDGKVLWRQDNYEGGALALANALRDADPLYDPNKDPQPNKPKPLAPDASGTSFNAWWLIIPAVVVVLFLLWRKR